MMNRPRFYAVAVLALAGLAARAARLRRLEHGELRREHGSARRLSR